MYKKILVSLLIGLFGLLNSGLAYAGFLDNTNSTGNNFSASTLFFNLTDATDSPMFYPLFYVSDLKPDEIKSSSFIINKGGTEDFKYNIYFVKTGGDEGLCNALNIEAKLEGATLYTGSLSELSILPSPTITDGVDNWELIISLSDSSPDLREKNCSFDLVVKGWQIDSDGSWGFFDFDSLDNDVSTTTWEVPDMSLEIEIANEAEQSDPSAQMEPDISEEPAPSEEIIDPTLTPTPLPLSGEATPVPEEVADTAEILTPTPTPVSVSENQEAAEEGVPE